MSAIPAAAERGEEIASPRAGQVEHISTVMTFREFLLSVSLAVAPLPLAVILVSWAGR
jgi:hypothetical protein